MAASLPCFYFPKNIKLKNDKRELCPVEQLLLAIPVDTYKYVIWVVPLNATEEENINDDFIGFDGFDKEKCPYIGNFMDLNEKHIKILIEIKRLYLNNKDIFNNNSDCVLNITTISPTYHCVHFHIYENKEYKSGFIKNEIGTRISGDLTLNKILNNITWKHNYYNSINITIFKV